MECVSYCQENERIQRNLHGYPHWACYPLPGPLHLIKQAQKAHPEILKWSGPPFSRVTSKDIKWPFWRKRSGGYKVFSEIMKIVRYANRSYIYLVDLECIWRPWQLYEMQKMCWILICSRAESSFILIVIMLDIFWQTGQNIRRSKRNKILHFLHILVAGPQVSQDRGLREQKMTRPTRKTM